MATLVLTAVGAALGGPLGGALGSLVGQSIDQQLFGPGLRKGPRLNDLSVQTSSYGSPIPRIYGAMRVAGTVVWATDIKENETIEGGGKSSPEYVAYHYSASFAVALSSRRIGAVRRIWADGKLIRGAAGDFKVKTKFRLLQGSEDQAIDPLIGSVETIIQTPAYRGLALAVFEDLDLGEFGNRIPVLTLEVDGDDGGIAIDELLRDASDGLIDADEAGRIAGFAAHGTSVRDALAGLIDIAEIQLTEHQGRLCSPSNATPSQILDHELGCDGEGRQLPRIERIRSPESAMPGSLTMTYYDPDRDYQTGQMRASAGRDGARDERIELPAVLSGSSAKALAEAGLSRRWRAGQRLRVQLPPARMDIRPGNSIQLPDSSRAWTVKTITIDGMAVVIEAEAAPVSVAPLPADPGRPVSEGDIPIGRSAVALFELPATGDTPASSLMVYATAANEGRWKPLPLELALNGAPLTSLGITKRSILGRAETLLESRSPPLLDERSSVIVQLANSSHALLNVDPDALMAGANLALLGEELIQFGRAELLAAGHYRLSNLLRGRRGTEWAAGGHTAGEAFCLIDAAALRPIELPPSAVGGNLKATAHGIGDIAPLPTAERLLSGEALRPPSPCHLRLWKNGSLIRAEWVRRSHRGWTWVDGVGVADDPFPELYRLELQGPGGSIEAETGLSSVSWTTGEVPASPGQQLSLSVAAVGPLALSRNAITHLMV